MNGVVCPSANYPPMKWIRLPVNKKDSCNSPLVCPIYIDTQCKS